jgi:hypothetical protein
MSFPWIRPIAAVALLATAAVAAGCDNTAGSAAADKPSATSPASTPAPPKATGLESQAVRTIMKRTRSASLAAVNLRMRGTIADQPAGPITFDLIMTKGGGRGDFSVGGVAYSVLTIGKTVYLQMSEAAIRAQSKESKSSRAETQQALKVLKNKWIKLSKIDQGAKAMVDLVTPGLFFQKVFGKDDTDSSRLPDKTAVRTVDGVRCVGLSDSGGVFWVDTATGRLVNMTDGKNHFSFSDYDRVPTPKTPAKHLVVDGRQLGL